MSRQRIVRIVCYDISDDSIRDRISRLCEQYGGIRIQKSVFEFPEISDQDLLALLDDIKRANPQPSATDSVVVYEVPERYYKRRIFVLMGEEHRKKFRGGRDLEEL
jgi:CRISPR-associated endonuclease Cas2